MSSVLATCPQLTLADLVSGLPAALAGIAPTGLVLDSRSVRPGDVFVAVPGTDSDGRHYIEQALAAGAAAVLAESVGLDVHDARVAGVEDLRQQLPEIARQFYGDPSARMAVVAVTGTNGKTSTADFVAQLLHGQGVAAGCVGTLGARLGREVVAARNTTPDTLTLNRQLAEWLKLGVDHVALEASSHALDQARLAGLNVHTGIFTNLSRDHFDYHGSEAAYLTAKLRLFDEFPLKRAIYNADDPQAHRVREVATCPTVGISLQSAEADVFVQIMEARSGLRMRVHSPWGTRDISAGLSGSFNAFNLAAAVVAVVGMGYPLADVIHAAEQVRPVPGRMQTLTDNAGLQVVVDYAHTPDALERALMALRSQTQGQLWVVFGCGGDRDPGKRAEMGRVAALCADRLVVTSDNPRSEAPEVITHDILEGVTGQSHLLLDRRDAIEFALSEAAPGDTVLIAGKGHEDYQEVSGQRLPFSDAAIAAAVLARGGAA